MHTHQVLVYFSCYNKLPWSVWLKQQICISLFWKVKDQLGGRSGVYWGPAFWFADGCLLLCGQEREEVSSLVSLLIRSPIPSRGLYPHDLQWVILLVKLTGLRNFQMAGKPLFLSLSVRVFLGEISIWINRLSKEDQPHQCGWAQRVWTNIKEETFDIWHLSSILRYWHCWFLGLWTQTELYRWLPWFSRQQIVGLGLHNHVSQFLE